MLVLVIIFMVIILLGFVGNSIVLFVIGVNKQLHDSTNILISNLALADLLFLTFCVPLTAYSYIYLWDFSEAVCYWMVTLQYVTCYVSIWTLVFLACDRCLSITSPTRLRSIRRGPAVIYVCVAIWVVMFLVNYPQMRDVGVIEQTINNTVVHYCVDSLEIGRAEASALSARIFFWGFNIGAYMLPLSLSTIFYLFLVKALWKEKLAHSKSSQRMKRHATKMVFTVIITFGVCWFPQNLRFFLRGYSYPELGFWEHNEVFLLVAQSTAQVLAYANSCVNPILYGVLSERFRNGVRHVCLGCPKKRRPSEDVYYKQKFLSKALYDSSKTPCDSRNRSPKSGSPENRRSQRFLMALDRSSAVSSMEDLRYASRPFEPRSATLRSESSDADSRDSVRL